MTCWHFRPGAVGSRCIRSSTALSSAAAHSDLGDQLKGHAMEKGVTTRACSLRLTGFLNSLIGNLGAAPGAGDPLSEVCCPGSEIQADDSGTGDALGLFPAAGTSGCGSPDRRSWLRCHGDRRSRGPGSRTGRDQARRGQRPCPAQEDWCSRRSGAVRAPCQPYRREALRTSTAWSTSSGMVWA